MDENDPVVDPFAGMQAWKLEEHQEWGVRVTVFVVTNQAWGKFA
jgi:hypothetical protein